jgi:hydroxypyruvate isomerase
MLFNEHRFLDRFAAAANAGFKGVEFLFPYANTKSEIAEQLSANGLIQVLFNLPPGDWDKGERGIASHPGRENEFKDGVGRAIDYAKALGCKMVNCLAGIAPKDVPREKAWEVLISNVSFAAKALEKEGVLLVVEPINFYDIPGFFLNRSADGMAVIEACKSGNVKLQYDLYHMQRMEGELAATAEKLLPHIGHMQLADNPGRNEPGTGEINYPFLFRHLDKIGYTGWIGCEYRPKAGTVDGLGWFKAALAGA